MFPFVYGERPGTFRAGPMPTGGREGIRTPGLLVANEALSQLSYSPIAHFVVVFTALFTLR